MKSKAPLVVAILIFGAISGRCEGKESVLAEVVGRMIQAVSALDQLSMECTVELSQHGEKLWEDRFVFVHDGEKLFADLPYPGSNRNSYYSYDGNRTNFIKMGRTGMMMFTSAELSGKGAVIPAWDHPFASWFRFGSSAAISDIWTPRRPSDAEGLFEMEGWLEAAEFIGEETTEFGDAATFKFPVVSYSPNLLGPASVDVWVLLESGTVLKQIIEPGGDENIDIQRKEIYEALSLAPFGDVQEGAHAVMIADKYRWTIWAGDENAIVRTITVDGMTVNKPVDSSIFDLDPISAGVTQIYDLDLRERFSIDTLLR